MYKHRSKDSACSESSSSGRLSQALSQDGSEQSRDTTKAQHFPESNNASSVNENRPPVVSRRDGEEFARPVAVTHLEKIVQDKPTDASPHANKNSSKERISVLPSVRKDQKSSTDERKGTQQVKAAGSSVENTTREPAIVSSLKVADGKSYESLQTSTVLHNGGSAQKQQQQQQQQQQRELLEEEQPHQLQQMQQHVATAKERRRLRIQKPSPESTINSSSPPPTMMQITQEKKKEEEEEKKDVGVRNHNSQDPSTSTADKDIFDQLPQVVDIDVPVRRQQEPTTKKPHRKPRKAKRARQVAAPPPQPPPLPQDPDPPKSSAVPPSSSSQGDRDQASSGPSQLIKGLLYTDVNKYAAAKQASNTPVVTTTDLLNQKRKLKKIDRSADYDPVSLGRKELFDAVYETRQSDPPDFIPLNLAKPVIVTQNISADLTTLQLAGLELLTDLTFAMLLGDRVQPVKKFFNLKKVFLSGCANITDQGLKWIGEIFPELSMIEMHGCVKVTERGLHYLYEGCQKLHVCLAMSCGAALIPDSICQTLIPKGSIAWAGNPIITEGSQYYIQYYGAMPEDFYDPKTRKLVVIRDSDLSYQVLPFLTGSKGIVQPSIFDMTSNLKVPSLKIKEDVLTVNSLETSLDAPLVDSLVTDGSIVMFVFNSPAKGEDMASLAKRLAERICSVLLQSPDVFILLVDTGQDSSGAIYDAIVKTLTDIVNALQNTSYTLYQSANMLDCLDFKGQRFVARGMAAVDHLTRLIHPQEVKGRFVYHHGPRDSLGSWLQPVLSQSVDAVKSLAPYVHCQYQVNVREFLQQVPHLGVSTHLTIFKQTDQSARQRSIKRYSFPRLGSILKVLGNWGQGLFLKSSSRTLCSTDLQGYKAICDLILSQAPPASVWVDCCQTDIPCWTWSSLQTAFHKGQLTSEILDCLNILKRQGMLLRLHSELYKGGKNIGDVWIRWQDVPTSHDILASLWPEPRPKVRILQSNRVYTLLPVVPSGFMPKLIRTLLKLFRPLLIWKTGFLLRQGPVDVKAELFRNSVGNTVLLVSTRIIQLDMDAKFKAKEDWRQSTDETRKVMFACTRQVVAVIEYACLRTKVYPHITLPCPKCAEFQTTGILDVWKCWHLPFYVALSNKHKACPHHKMINSHFLVNLAEEHGEGPSVPRHNYPYHVAVSSFIRDMVEGLRHREMEPPPRCYYCGRGAEIPCLHCHMCSRCTRNFAKLAKALQPGGVNSKSFKLLLGNAVDKKEEEKIKGNSKGCSFYYRKGHCMLFHYAMSPFYFDELSLIMLRDTHCMLTFTLETGRQMVFQSKFGTFMKQTGEKLANEMMKVRDTNSVVIRVDSVELGRRIRLSISVRGKEAYSEELEGWDIKVDLNCEKSGLYIMQAPGIKRSWQQTELERFAKGSVLEVATGDGKVHPATIVEKDQMGNLLLDANGIELRHISSSPMLYPLGTTAAGGGSLTATVPTGCPQVPVSAFLMSQVPCGWDKLIRHGMGSDLPTNPNTFDTWYNKDPLLSAYISPCCTVHFPSVMSAHQTLLNNPLESLLYSQGQHNYSMLALLVLPAIFSKDDFTICGQQVCIDQFKLHPLCYNRADVNSTMTTNPSARLGKYVECFHSLHMVDNQGTVLSQLQDPSGMVGIVVLWAWIRMLLRLQTESLPHYTNILKGVDGIDQLPPTKIHDTLMEALSILGDAMFLNLGLDTNVMERFDEEAIQRWMDIYPKVSDNQGLEKVQLMFMEEYIYMCGCHKEMWALNQALTAYTPPKGDYLCFMRSLSLEGNNLESVPPELFTSMSNLVDLILMSNKLTSLPNEVGHCRKLKTLALGSNKLTQLPNTLAQCQLIIRLDIERNRFTEFPLVVTKLKKLRRLYAQHLHLNSLPDAIGELTELVTLSLNGNCFVDLPEGLGRLQKLTSLSLNGVVWLKSKHNVLLSRDHFEEFLNENNLLHWLDMHNQNKQSIFSLFDEDTNGTLDPKEIGKLNATMFYVFPRFGYKGRKTPDEDTPHGFPRVLLQLKSLEYLSMQYQGLVSLPEEIGQLTSLNNLHLGNNPNLLTIPAQLGGLELKRLELDSCPLLKTPPKEIRARGFITTFAYLKRLLSGSVSCKRTKLMLVGLGGAGKTSLVKALLSKKKMTELTVGEEITDGIDICPWTVPTPDGGEITYSVWDFAGQTVYYNTHQFFLSDRAVYFLMWNIRLGHEHAGLDFWLNSIRVHAPKAPIFVVGTHLDQVSKVELPMKEMQKKFPQICGFHFVSSHSGQGVPELQEHMIAETLKQQYMGEKIPGAWLTFEDNLKKVENKSIIRFRELETIATRSGIFDNNEVIQAVQFLHQLGSIQHFTNPSLKSHVVINPQWIVDMMACVVSVKDSPIKSGKFRHSDLAKVWKDYDPDLHTWMLKLTEEFDLTFPLKDSPINLVPCLLPEKKPEFEWPERDKGNYSRETKMIYKFDYLPAGLFNRSQVRLHQFSDSSLIWKRGSYLKKNKHICLLFQSRDCELTVKAIGPSPENILFLVHEVFESLILESFKGISYDFSVPCPDCMKLTLKGPHMFPASIVRRATELKAPFLQCIKYFHTISITDIHAVMPPDTNQDFDLHLVHAVRGMKELQNNLAADIFVSYCPLDDKNPAAENVRLGQICADVEKLGYKCWVPQDSKPQSLDEMAKALLDAKIFLVFMSNNYVKDETCCNLFKYARLTLRKPLVLIATGQDLSWKQSNLGILMADEVFINMMKISRYPSKFEELKSMLHDKYSPSREVRDKAVHPCFISYCWQNSAQAVAKGSRTTEGAVGFGDPRAIKDYLEGHGIKCWIDVERVGVHGLFEDIGEGLLRSQVVVVCMSDQYAASDNCSIEFRYAANTLKLPVILAVVGTGNKWRASELGVMSLNHPLVSFQEGSETALNKLLDLVTKHLPNKKEIDDNEEKEKDEQENQKSDKDAVNWSLKEKQQLSLQEICELAQRKFLRQVSQYMDMEQDLSYPGVMMVDFTIEEPDESEVSHSSDSKAKSETASLTSVPQEARSSPKPENSIQLSSERTITATTHAKKAYHADIHDQRFEVHLLCEHEEGWHKSGDAIFLDKDFGHSLERYLPYIARVTAIARYSQKLPLNCQALDIGQKYLSWMEENPIVTLASDFHESFQALRSLVISADEDLKMGGLQRCLLPSGKTIWLCPKHRQSMRVTALAKESATVIHNATQQSMAVDQMALAMRDIDLHFLPSRLTKDAQSPSSGDGHRPLQQGDVDSDSSKTLRRHASHFPEGETDPQSRPPLQRHASQPAASATASTKQQQQQQQRPLSRTNSKSRACLLM